MARLIQRKREVVAAVTDGREMESDGMVAAVIAELRDGTPFSHLQSGSVRAMTWTVYLSGEIHTDWRERIASGAVAAGLDARFTGPVTDHGASDDCGAAILGEPAEPFFRDQLGAGVNAVRTRTLLAQADVVVVRFGEQYRQWNAAFDAGAASALGQGADHAAPAGARPRAERGRPRRAGRRP